MSAAASAAKDHGIREASATRLDMLRQSSFNRWIAAPILFVSFLISLFLIDRKTYGLIVSRRTEPDTSSSEHDLHQSTHQVKSKSEEYYHSNKRKLARQEVEDAFQMRNKVIFAIVAGAGLGVGVLAWIFRQAFAYAWTTG